MPTNKAEWQKWFEAVWAQREETLYRSWFGAKGMQMHNLPAQQFKAMGLKEIDERWLTHSVIECSPESEEAGAGRKTWVYITSGLSNPWGKDPAEVKAGEYSGLGLELMLETKERSFWAISTLHWLMSVQILVAMGYLEGSLLEYFDRVPLGVSVDPNLADGQVRNLLVGEPVICPKQLELASGVVDLMEVVGITDREMDFARSQGGPSLVDVLKHHGVWPVTDAGRVSVL